MWDPPGAGRRYDARVKRSSTAPAIPAREPLLLGHRGSPRAHRENTLASFQAALNAGLDGVELDVRRARCGTLVVHHDAHLFDGRAIAECTFRELRPHPVPTLAEVLALVKDADAYVNVELKYERAAPDDRVARSAQLLTRYGLERHSVVSSFNPLLLRALKGAAPAIERGFLFHREYRLGRLDAVDRVARALGVAALHPHWRLVTPELMRLARVRGWRVNVWTVNDEAQARRLLDLGVDALIGDLPEVLLRARRSVR